MVLQGFIWPIQQNEAAILAVLLLIALDIVFGLANAIIKKEYRSSKMREGIGHKCAELGVVLVGIVSDAAVNAGLDIGFDVPVLASICVYLCIMEIGSLLETFAKMNPSLVGMPVFKVLAGKAKLTEGEDD